MMQPAKPDYAGDTEHDVPNLNLPNLLTFLRLLLVPVFAFLLPQSQESESVRWWATAVFGVASLTDLIDGYVARKYRLITNLGKIADPIADKLLIGTALIALSLEQTVSWWFTAVILSREIAITLLRFKVINRGVIPASRGGKAKTISQIVAILAYLVPLSGNIDFVALVAMWTAAILTIGTGIDYLVRAYRLPVQQSSDEALK
ncbi:MAG: CDP-diacylglycerol--glycerol-3-phosphate 3-phosphatidyltransferase [Actinobacteria bacterium]|nr:CDP-diacylglycerol--glycerol-3-phosphate 3-phosphatidyltransferase [Actinomycetota bacterium]